MRHTRILFLGLLFVLSSSSAAQEQPSVPTEVQRLKIQVAVRDMEISQLRFEEARGRLAAMLQELRAAGCVFDIQTQQCAKVSEP